LGLRVARQRGENRTMTGLRATLLCGAMLAVTAPSAHAALSWDTASHDFGGHNVGTSTSRTFTLTATCTSTDDFPFCTNPMSGLHSFGAPSVIGTGFAIGSPNTCSSGFLQTTFFVTPATCETTVVFSPVAATAHTGLLATPNGPDIALSGTGVAPASTPPAPTKRCKKQKKGKKGAAAAKKCKRKKK
jgi:hypothetical protein